jgi:hypothetical protein
MHTNSWEYNAHSKLQIQFLFKLIKTKILSLLMSNISKLSTSTFVRKLWLSQNQNQPRKENKEFQD